MLTPLTGCVATAPVTLGTGSAVADIVLGEALRAGAAEIAPQVMAMAMGGMDQLSRFGGNPKWTRLIPGRGVRRINGMIFVGDGW